MERLGPPAGEEPVLREPADGCRPEALKMEPLETLRRSRALWNRDRLDLESDEVLAQLVDRGSLEDWKALHQLMSDGSAGAEGLCERVHRVLYRAPTGHPYFWLAALSRLGHSVDWEKEPAKDPGEARL